jgi:hypothetical protein
MLLTTLSDYDVGFSVKRRHVIRLYEYEEGISMQYQGYRFALGATTHNNSHSCGQ